jgi:hypothetical protein
VVVLGARVEELCLNLRPPSLLREIRHHVILSHQAQTSAWQGTDS